MTQPTPLPTAVAREAASRQAPTAPPAVDYDAPAVSQYARQHGITDEDAFRVLSAQAAALDLPLNLQDVLGDRFAGMWFDNSKLSFGVGVAGPDAGVRDDARALVASRKLPVKTEIVAVERSWTDLLQTQQSVLSRGLESITGVWLSAKDNVVVAVLDAGAPTGLIEQDRERLRSLPDSVRVDLQVDRPVPQTACGYRPRYGTGAYSRVCDRPLRGGVNIFDTATHGNCTSGFNATANGYHYVVTAGHCTASQTTWDTLHYSSNNAHVIGVSSSSVFSDSGGPGGDYGTILMSGADTFWRDVLSPAEAVTWGYSNDYVVHGVSSNPGYQGMSICVSSPMQAGTPCGTVDYPNYYVYYGATRVGPLEGVYCGGVPCTVPGDSGGPWLVANYAVGTTSGGSSTVSFYSPVVNTIAHYSNFSIDVS